MKASKRTAHNPPQPKHIAKWGFGMAPISPTMRARYDRAVQSLLDVVDGRVDPSDVDPNDISELNEQAANLTKGAQLEFDIRAKGQGLAAVDVHLVEPTSPTTRQA